VSHPLKKFPDYVALMASIIGAEPSNYEKAVGEKVWQNAMVEKYNSTLKDDVWERILRPTRKLVIDSKWFYNVKHAVDGIIEKYKVRLVARILSQNDRVDHEETFAPISRFTSITTIMFLASVFDWPLYQMDVKTTFLHGLIEEEVSVHQSRGFEVHGQDTMCVG
jgi:hypothetical protein